MATEDQTTTGDTAVLTRQRALPGRRAPLWYPPVVVYPVRHNGFAIVGATLGSVSLFVSLLPLLGMLSWLLAPLGLATSTVGLAVGILRGAGRAGALLGIAASSLALALGLGWVLLIRML